MSHASNALYVRKHFDLVCFSCASKEFQNARKAILDLFEEIRAAFSEVIRENEWMDEATKRLAVEKMYRVQVFVGFADFILEDARLDSFYAQVVLPRFNEVSALNWTVDVLQ